MSGTIPRTLWDGEGSAVRIDGTALAARTLDELRGRIDRLHEHGIRPGLGTIMVGANPGSMSYVAGKHRDSASTRTASTCRRPRAPRTSGPRSCR